MDMTPWTFYPVFLATLVSVIGLSHLAITQHQPANPRTLSELAAAEQIILNRFRNILVFCGSLFALTVFGFILPRISQPVLIGVFGGLMVVGELAASIIPARHKTLKIHTLMAQLMSIGMLGLAAVFWVCLDDGHQLAEGIFTILMCISGALTFLDRRHFIIYELIFIFLSHFSILIAAIALH